MQSPNHQHLYTQREMPVHGDIECIAVLIGVVQTHTRMSRWKRLPLSLIPLRTVNKRVVEAH